MLKNIKDRRRFGNRWTVGADTIRPIDPNIFYLSNSILLGALPDRTVKCRHKILILYLLQLRHGNGGGVLHLHFIGAHPQRRVQV